MIFVRENDEIANRLVNAGFRIKREFNKVIVYKATQLDTSLEYNGYLLVVVPTVSHALCFIKDNIKKGDKEKIEIENILHRYGFETERDNHKNITPVPVLYDGLFDEKAIRKLWDAKDWGQREGYVVRLADPIGYGEFRHKFAKFVRKGHVQTVKHWMHGQPIERNILTVMA